MSSLLAMNYLEINPSHEMDALHFTWKWRECKSKLTQVNLGRLDQELDFAFK